MRSPELRRLLTEVKTGLQDLYGHRLRGLYLFGSHARGEATPDSDVDLLIVLDVVESYYRELELTAELISDLSLRHDVSLSRVLMSEEQWRRGEGPFLLTVREDAVAA